MKYASKLFTCAALALGLSAGSAFAGTNGYGEDTSAVVKKPISKVRLAARLANIPGLSSAAIQSIVEPQAPVSSCDVLDATGTPVSTISASNVGDQSYWFRYNSGGASSTQVLFLAVPLFTGSPIDLIYQRFNPNGSTNIVTPFGVPYWGGDLTSGTWLHVSVANGDTSPNLCRFIVTP